MQDGSVASVVASLFLSLSSLLLFAASLSFIARCIVASWSLIFSTTNIIRHYLHAGATFESQCLQEKLTTEKGVS